MVFLAITVFILTYIWRFWLEYCSLICLGVSRLDRTLTSLSRMLLRMWPSNHGRERVSLPDGRVLGRKGQGAENGEVEVPVEAEDVHPPFHPPSPTLIEKPAAASGSQWEQIR